MTTLFVACAVGGVGLLVVGLLIGEVFDGLLEGVFDALDVDGGGVLSLPVLGAFVGAFGIGGLLIGAATDDSAPLSLIGGVVAGVAMGAVALRATRAFLDMPTDATPASRDFMGQIGRVVTPIAGGRGEVMVRLGGSPQKLTALAEAGVDIARGDEVVVIEVVSPSTVRVIPATEILENP